MTREEAIQRFNGIIRSMSISVAQSKFYPSKVILNELCDMAIEALSADIPQGEWKSVTEMFYTLDGIKTYITGMRCSNCYHMFDVRDYNYCPNCGADMKGGAE